MLDKIKILKRVDLFGKPLNFELNDSNYYNTWIGFFSTISIIITCIIIGFLFGKEIYERKTASVNYEEEFVTVSRINRTDIPIVFSFQDRYVRDVPDIDKIFTVQYKFFNSMNKGVEQENAYGFIPCDHSLFNPRYKEMYEEYDKKELKFFGFTPYCLRNDFKYGFLQNGYAEINAAFLSVNLILCDPNERECHPNLKWITDEVFMRINYIDSYINPNNYTHPINYYMNTLTIQLNNIFQKRVYLTFLSNIVKTDTAWLLENTNEESFVEAKQPYTDADNALATKISAKILIISDRLRKKVVRSYMKVQELLAKIGGFFQFLVVLVKVLLTHYINFHFIIIIIHIIF